MWSLQLKVIRKTERIVSCRLKLRGGCCKGPTPTEAQHVVRWREGLTQRGKGVVSRDMRIAALRAVVMDVQFELRSSGRRSLEAL